MENLVNIMQDSQLQDIVMAGWLSGETNHKEFVPIQNILLFRFESGTMLLSSFEGYIDVSSHSDASIEYDTSELGEACVISLLNLFVREGDVNRRISNFAIYKDTHTSHIEALRIDMCGGTILFVEVDIVYGLHLSSGSEIARWVEWRTETNQEFSVSEYQIRQTAI